MYLVENVSFSYAPSVPTLQGISLEVHKGEFLSLIGPNGSGKTTLLRLLDRIYLPQQGKILFSGKDIATYSRSELARHIAFVPQENTILFPFTVMEIVLMGRAPHSRGAAFENPHDREIALGALKLTDAEHLAHHSITALSGGERQRVLIARALAQQPDLILLDEPNAHLDITHQVEIFQLLKKLNHQSGLTVVSVSHELNLASTFSDRIGMLVCGSLVVIGPPHEVLTEARILEVFRTNVIVDEHPHSRAPRVTPTFSTSLS